MEFLFGIWEKPLHPEAHALRISVFPIIFFHHRSPGPPSPGFPSPKPLWVRGRGLGSVLFFAAIWFYSDVAEYAEKKQEAEIEKWEGIPVGLWWYGFITVAVQVHLYSLFFALN
ncbi:hypothetical protein TNIN_172031 [Trichonephila inaurata madagascariensis]|uniref:Uncharacterized protein n=1 Tax=Trichonephila inaurata madagascariensis TaxID=2747483 RepID=A0A8X7BY02_9ARAC|nr:hypothetical protein TNIN_172031 [Trichonephila inaurata madagascariensis]